MKGPIVGLLFAITVLALAIAMRGGKEDRAPAPVKGATASNAPAEVGRSPEAVLSITPKSPNTRPIREAPKRSPLMQEYVSKQGRKALYDRLSAQSTRTAEEDYVLAEMLNTCRHAVGYEGEPVDKIIADARSGAMAGLSPKDPMREKRIAAYDAMYDGIGVCKGFRDVPITKERIRDLMTAAAQAGDPRAQARLIELDIWAPLAKYENDPVQFVRRENLPSMSPEQVASLQRLASTNDPDVLIVAARLFGSTMGDMQIQVGPDERAVDVRAFYDAWVLAACDAGYECGPRHEMILGGCFAMGNCDAQNLRDYLFFYMNPPQQSQLVADYQAAIQRAIQSGDWSYFRFNRGPPPTATMAMRPPP